MISLDKLRVIAKAKLSRKDNLGEWYQTRLDICSSCPLNSKNREKLTVKEKALLVANLGQDFCIGCGCEIAAKTSVREEVCGAVKIGQEPLWGPLPAIREYNFQNLRLKNLSSDLITLETTVILVMDYGTIKRNADTAITISMEGLSSKITNMKISSGCGCTTTEKQVLEGVHFISLKYDSSRMGAFSKTVVFSFTQGRVNYRITGKLKGNVIK
jgi:hypothetical protein